MPVIVGREAEAIWLDPAVQDPARRLPLLKPYRAEEMVAYPVRQALNSPHTDSADIILPLRER